jgi:exodeoxyribonuclease V alpha subunit
MLHRNLFYTAVTRGKKQVYLVGSKKAVAIAVQNNEVKKRHTGLLKKLSS